MKCGCMTWFGVERRVHGRIAGFHCADEHVTAIADKTVREIGKPAKPIFQKPGGQVAAPDTMADFARGAMA